MSVQCEQVQELVFWFRFCLPSSHDFDCVRVTAHSSQANAVDFVFLNVQDKHVQVDEEEDDEEDVEEEVDSAVKSTILSSSESESLTREMTSMIMIDRGGLLYFEILRCRCNGFKAPKLIQGYILTLTSVK